MRRLEFIALPLALAVSACTPRDSTRVGERQAPPHPVVAPPTTPLPAANPPPAPTEAARPAFGTPIALGRLTVYPVTLALAAQDDPGPLMLLDDALAQGLAEVREVGGDEPSPLQRNVAPRQHRHVRRGESLNAPAQNHLDNQDIAPQDNIGEQVQLQGLGGGATVNTLVIENKSERAIFVLAGTVVKGGKQDRQIGQDFVVDAKTTVPVDAFCVERGRWNADRDGQATGGKFVTVETLANSKVRAAGQYQQNQQEVWDNVALTNKAHAKENASGTLLATLDSPDVKARLEEVAASARRALSASSPAGTLVGFAWAIDGKIGGVRHFAHHRVWDLVAVKLTQTIAADLLTAEAAGSAPTPAAAAPSVAELEAFVAEAQKGQVEQRETGAANDNLLYDSERAWSSTTVLKGKAGRAKKAIAWDYLAK